ncbi:head-tail connector protein [Geobacillus subterraneus]|uniref:head-tail connector protein n=1 Tax=Geobacillus subterraneus TaxID=129338 RepID=UPI002AC9A53F|nr:head-tail connector protein [Geobacillus subterraneus]WPZ17795.1 head-tail connector protein [Geobacillus subterraneus]
MTLEELKTRLKIPMEDTSQDDYLQAALEDAISYVKEYCRNDFVDGLPSGVKAAVAKLVKALQEDGRVASQSIGDMSKSFFEGGTMNEVHRLLQPYRKARFV